MREVGMVNVGSVRVAEALQEEEGVVAAKGLVGDGEENERRILDLFVWCCVGEQEGVDAIPDGVGVEGVVLGGGVQASGRERREGIGRVGLVLGEDVGAGGNAGVEDHCRLDGSGNEGTLFICMVGVKVICNWEYDLFLVRFLAKSEEKNIGNNWDEGRGEDMRTLRG